MSHAVFSEPVAVLDPDLEIRGGGSSRSLNKKAWSPNINFPALQASIWSKNKGH